MALFESTEFDALAINPFDKDQARYKRLVKQVFGNVASSDIEVINYVVLMYDSKSPFRLKVPLLSDRKKECAEAVVMVKGKMESVFDLSYENIIKYISSYLRYQQSKIWSVLSANEEVLWQYQSELLTPITQFKTDKDKLQALEIKSKLMAECDAIIKRIEAYEEKLFGDNTDKKDKILNMTPEAIANV